MYAQNYKYDDGRTSDIRRPMEDVGPPKWDITLTLIFSWLIIFLCMLKGIAQTKLAELGQDYTGNALSKYQLVSVLYNILVE